MTHFMTKRLFFRFMMMVTLLVVLFTVSRCAAEIVVPSISTDFVYKADILSIDNFHDESRGKFLGEQLSKTIFSYTLAGKTGGVYLLNNIFDVKTLSGKPIFNTTRIYAVDRAGRHVPGHGDKDRTGYLFGPRNLKSEQPFTYWHINYDEPARMKFKSQETINDLVVYRYEADYHADQTSDLAHLPGVGVEHGINLDINLKLWIEPMTGRMIKYEDSATAYYYNLTTNERIHPWNQFSNRLTASSIAEQVDIAKTAKHKILMIRWGVPAVLVFVGLIAAHFVNRRTYLKKGRKA